MTIKTIKNAARRKLWEKSVVADRAKDADGLAALWHSEGSFQIGAQPLVKGRENIRQFFGHFFSMPLFTRLDHEMSEVWDLEDVLIYSAEAIYTRANGEILKVPYTNIVKYKDGLFFDYHVYIDTKPLFG
jgi:hypothetical protein